MSSFVFFEINCCHCYLFALFPVLFTHSGFLGPLPYSQDTQVCVGFIQLGAAALARSSLPLLGVSAEGTPPYPISRPLLPEAGFATWLRWTGFSSGLLRVSMGSEALKRSFFYLNA